MAETLLQEGVPIYVFIYLIITIKIKNETFTILDSIEKSMLSNTMINLRHNLYCLYQFEMDNSSRFSPSNYHKFTVSSFPSISSVTKLAVRIPI